MGKGGMEKRGEKKEYLLETRIRREQRGRLWIIRSTTTILKPADCLYRETSLYRSRRWIMSRHFDSRWLFSSPSTSYRATDVFSLWRKKKKEISIFKRNFHSTRYSHDKRLYLVISISFRTRDTRRRNWNGHARDDSGSEFWSLALMATSIKHTDDSTLDHAFLHFTDPLFMLITSKRNRIRESEWRWFRIARKI